MSSKKERKRRKKTVGQYRRSCEPLTAMLFVCCLYTCFPARLQSVPGQHTRFHLSCNAHSLPLGVCDRCP
eukprot:2574734-Rhodomonas_salina.1